MTSPQIAFIGTEGSGKTVLLTVLAKRLSQFHNGIFLNPVGTKPAKYIEDCWNKLQSKDWLPSTSPGALFDLCWTLKIRERKCPLRLIDSAGQDLLKLFHDEGYADPTLSETDKLFIAYLQKSTILLLLINLRDFLDEPDLNQKFHKQMTLKNVLETLETQPIPKKIAIVFTQYDQHRKSIESKWGSCRKFIEQELPLLYGACTKLAP
jgi:GTPase SAR1 family protein